MLPPFHHRVRRLEKRLKSLLGDDLPPSVTEKDLDYYGFLLWWYNIYPADNPRTLEDEEHARAQFQQLPEAQRQHWRQQARQMRRYLKLHPEIISNVFEEIANQWFPEDQPF